MKENVNREEDRVARLIQAKVDAMRKEENKLKYLNLGYITLPPEIGLHVRPKGGQTIVGVHYLEREREREREREQYIKGQVSSSTRV